jgi:hypothetical protein
MSCHWVIHPLLAPEGNNCVRENLIKDMVIEHDEPAAEDFGKEYETSGRH